MELLDEFRPCFTAPAFTTFALLAAGLVARPAGRTVCGMLAGAGLGGVWHHSRAHRFFASAAWSADAVGLRWAWWYSGWLIPAGAPVVIAVDDTMFRHAGRKVHAAYRAYDGSLKVPKGGKKISRGNTFVIAAVIVELPFLRLPAALPAAARLWRRRGPAKTALARELTGLIAAAPACRRRAVHLFADTACICTGLRRLPAGVTLTGPLPRHASLYDVHPELDYPPARGRQRGRPRAKDSDSGRLSRRRSASQSSSSHRPGPAATRAARPASGGPPASSPGVDGTATGMAKFAGNEAPVTGGLGLDTHRHSRSLVAFTTA